MASLSVLKARPRHCLSRLMPFDGVALLVSLGVEGRWPASVAASPQPVADLVGRLGDDRTDPASPEVIPNQTG